MTFSDALVLMKQGIHMRREAWREGKIVRMFEPVDDNKRLTGKKLLSVFYEHSEFGIGEPYLPSDEDMFADDWVYSKESLEIQKSVKAVLNQRSDATSAWKHKINNLF